MRSLRSLRLFLVLVLTSGLWLHFNISFQFYRTLLSSSTGTGTSWENEDYQAYHELMSDVPMPEICSKYFDPSFPIDLPRIVDAHLRPRHQARDWRTDGFSRQDIMRPACPDKAGSESQYATVVLVHNNTLFVHNTTPLTNLRFPKRVRHLLPLFREIRHAFSDESLPSVLFKWWSVDNPVATVCGQGKPNVFGTVSYSHCPPPYCSMGIAIPSSSDHESKLGRIHLEKTLDIFYNCTTNLLEERRPQGEWHGGRSGHSPMRFWDSPPAEFLASCSLWSEQNCTDKFIWDPSIQSKPNSRPMRQIFVDYFNKTKAETNGRKLRDLPKVVANFEKRDMCSVLSENRLLFAIAGGSYASNFYDNMISGAVTVKQNYPSWSFVEPFFEPNVHYLLARRDLSDIVQLSRYILSLDAKTNTTEFEQVRKMAERGRERAILLGKESPLLNICLYLYLFRRYAKMLRQDATEFHPDEWIELTKSMYRGGRE